MSACLMLAGTGSDVGKSLLAAGLCRAFSRRGLRVRPFKPQNMSNNAAVTANGGEIGRAQALQARACGVAPHSDMNPVLLKPQTDIGAQVVVQGKVWGNAKARQYQSLKSKLLPKVLESFERLRADADLIIVEGAGSIAEVNLRAGDIANMGFATACHIPVILIADIDRGGVIAALVGSYTLLDVAERALVKGYVINKFRGDVSLFDSGIAIVNQHTAWRCFGVAPYFNEAAKLPAEDAVALENYRTQQSERTLKIAVPVISRIANFDDLDPLRAEPDVAVDFVKPSRALPGDADMVILPGSKATIADLRFLREQGWDIDIRAHLRRGGWLIGICGGYQMLGASISDPEGIEGSPGAIEGLGLLDINTELRGAKTLVWAEGEELASGAAVYGYEMHIGTTTGAALERPWLSLAGRPDGAIAQDGKIMGCYLHGLFANDTFRHVVLDRIRHRTVSGIAYEQQIEQTLDGLASHLEQHLKLDELLEIARDA